MFCTACLAQIRIAFTNGQIARALFRVALGLAATAREAILTIAATVAELFAKVLRSNAWAAGVALTRMIARGEVEHVIRAGILLQLNLAAMHRPQPVLLLLLSRRCVVLVGFDHRNIGRLLLGEHVHLLAGLHQHCLRNGTVVVQVDLVQRPEERLVRTVPFFVGSFEQIEQGCRIVDGPVTVAPLAIAGRVIGGPEGSFLAVAATVVAVLGASFVARVHRGFVLVVHSQPFLHAVLGMELFQNKPRLDCLVK